jgi:hypothetical protein
MTLISRASDGRGAMAAGKTHSAQGGRS